MLLIRSQISDFLIYSYLLIIGFFGLPLAVWSRNGAYMVIKGYARGVFWILRVMCNLRVEVRGDIPEGEVLVCSKHMSFLDILMLSHALPRVKFIMKRELIWAPVIGVYGWRIGCAPVARGKKGAAIAGMVNHIESGAHDDGQTTIFPQGTRVLPGAKDPYKIGAGVIYTRMGQTCYPVATNCGVFWARRSPVRKPGVAVLEFLEPIPPGLELREFMSKIEDVIEVNSNRLMREAGFEV
ncbi:MAG: lysophospholipid acyltransferase family protein [Paracoccaceae bacterium]